MRNPLERIQELIPILPEKDIKIVNKYLNKRDFQSIIEIVESDIYKAERSNNVNSNYYLQLIELRDCLSTYLACTDIYYNDYDY